MKWQKWACFLKLSNSQTKLVSLSLLQICFPEMSKERQLWTPIFVRDCSFENVHWVLGPLKRRKSNLGLRPLFVVYLIIIIIIIIIIGVFFYFHYHYVFTTCFYLIMCFYYFVTLYVTVFLFYLSCLYVLVCSWSLCSWYVMFYCYDPYYCSFMCFIFCYDYYYVFLLLLLLLLLFYYYHFYFVLFIIFFYFYFIYDFRVLFGLKSSSPGLPNCSHCPDLQSSQTCIPLTQSLGPITSLFTLNPICLT